MVRRRDQFSGSDGGKDVFEFVANALTHVIHGVLSALRDGVARLRHHLQRSSWPLHRGFYSVTDVCWVPFVDRGSKMVLNTGKKILEVRKSRIGTDMKYCAHFFFDWIELKISRLPV